eukprot:326407_1
MLGFVVTDQISIDTVNGYIRRIQMILPKNKTFYNIPKLVNVIVLSYFYEQEFFETYSDDYITVSGENRNIITATHAAWHSAYGAFIIDFSTQCSNMIYEWTFRIFGSVSGIHAGGGDQLIAIDSTYNSLDTYMYPTSGMHYALHCNGHKYRSGESSMVYMTDGFDAGDVVILRINIQDKSMSFIKNGVDCGIAYSDIDTSVKYRVVISLGHRKGNGTELVSFRRKIH